MTLEHVTQGSFIDPGSLTSRCVETHLVMVCGFILVDQHKYQGRPSQSSWSSLHWAQEVPVHLQTWSQVESKPESRDVNSLSCVTEPQTITGHHYDHHHHKGHLKPVVDEKGRTIQRSSTAVVALCCNCVPHLSLYFFLCLLTILQN